MSLMQSRRAGRWNIEILQGSTFARTLAFSQDITGLQFRGQVRRSHSSPEVLAELSFQSVDSNTIAIHMPATQTGQLPAGRLVYDVEAYTSGGDGVARILEGAVLVSPEVTR